MKKIIATVKNAVKNAVKTMEESNKQMAHYQALNPMSYYLFNHSTWY